MAEQPSLPRQWRHGTPSLRDSGLDLDDGHGTKLGGRFDTLPPTPRAEGKTHMVWIAVEVPVDAALKLYAAADEVARALGQK
jgi:hypothetical protein